MYLERVPVGHRLAGYLKNAENIQIILTYAFTLTSFAAPSILTVLH
jgi:hypothetical protein